MIFQIDESKPKLIEALGVSNEEIDELRDGILKYVAAGFTVIQIIKAVQDEGVLNDPRKAFLFGLIVGYAALGTRK